VWLESQTYLGWLSAVQFGLLKPNRTRVCYKLKTGQGEKELYSGLWWGPDSLWVCRNHVTHVSAGVGTCIRANWSFLASSNFDNALVYSASNSEFQISSISGMSRWVRESTAPQFAFGHFGRNMLQSILGYGVWMRAIKTSHVYLVLVQWHCMGCVWATTAGHRTQQKKLLF